MHAPMHAQNLRGRITAAPMHAREHVGDVSRELTPPDPPRRHSSLAKHVQARSHFFDAGDTPQLVVTYQDRPHRRNFRNHGGAIEFKFLMFNLQPLMMHNHTLWLASAARIAPRNIYHIAPHAPHCTTMHHNPPQSTEDQPNPGTNIRNFQSNDNHSKSNDNQT